MKKWKYWTDADIEAIKDTSLTAKQCAEMLGRSEWAVRYKRRSLGIVMDDLWSDEEVAMLHDGQLTNAQISKATGRTVGAIKFKRHKIKKQKNMT